jgi:23S rRNA pseudouridine1911/1915/1917 synthase
MSESDSAGPPGGELGPPGGELGPIEIPAALAGMRLDRVVAMLADVNRSDAAALVDSGAVRVGAEPVRDRAKRLREGDRLVIDVSSVVPAVARRAAPLPSRDVPYEVVFADEQFIVVDKPAGVVVHPGAGNLEGTLVAGILDRYPEIGALPAAGAGELQRPGIVHRLDKDTSGLLVVARTPEAHRALSAQLASRTMGRRYLAIALGHLEAPRGVIDAPLGRSTDDPTKMAVTSAGRAARTGYEVLEVFDRPIAASELELSLETGRTHQIRVHLAAIGHPVLGDRRYGGARGAYPVPRCMLHAWKLRLAHPVSGEQMEFYAPAPQDFADALAGLSRT